MSMVIGWESYNTSIHAYGEYPTVAVNYSIEFCYGSCDKSHFHVLNCVGYKLELGSLIVEL